MKQSLSHLAAIGGLLLASSSVVHAAIVDVDFEDGTNPYENLVDFSTTHSPSGFPNTLGADGSNGLRYQGNGLAVNDTALTIGAETFFSVDGKYKGDVKGSNGGLAFGWTQKTAATSPWDGLNTNNTIMVGLVANGGHSYVLGYGDDISSFGLGNGFSGGSSTTLTSGNWYRLSGTVLYGGTTAEFTFSNIQLFDLGVTGTAAPGSAILSGSDTVGLSSSFWDATTTGRVGVITNRDRGFETTDNYYIAAVPEPSSTALLGLGGFALILRRRRA